MNDAGRRALRTFLDAAITTFLTLMTLPAFVSDVGGQPVPELGALTSVLAACAFSGVLAVLNFVKNALEDSTGRAFLIPKANPDPEATRSTVAQIVPGSDAQ